MNSSALVRKAQVRTAAQVTAADPGSSVWVSANAGTGKTQVLTDRITRLLLDGIKPERILCLTFTKAAAAEMATRLSERLGGWAVADEETLNAEIEALLGKPPEPTLLAPARRLFAETLDVPGGLKIRTIHAFCESLLGRFPVEAGIAPHFSVIDERTAAELMTEARDRVLAQAHAAGSENIARSLTLMAGLLNEDDFAKLMSDLSSRRSHLKALFNRYGSINGVIEASCRTLGLVEGETAETIVQHACEENSFDKAALLGAAKALSGGTKTDKVRAERLQVWLEGNGTFRRTSFENSYLDIFLKKTNEPRARLMTNKVAEASPVSLQALLDEQLRIAAISEKLRAIGIYAASEALIHLGSHLLEIFEHLKENRALLDYDDLILKARDLLQADGGASWVHYKLDGGLDHVLVDEAQDTSPQQWDVIKALSGDSVSGFP